jgi:RsiW-degrading membrane proteinase PrsW (M82 family)
LKNNNNYTINTNNRSAAGSDPNLTPKSGGFDWLAAGLFVFSLSAAFLLIGGSLLSAALMVLGSAFEGLSTTENQLISSLLFASGMGFIGLLMLPAVYYSGCRLFNYPPHQISKLPGQIWLLILLPGLIFLGYLIQTGPTWSKYGLVFFHVLVNSLGVYLVYLLVGRNLTPMSSLRNWGSFASGLSLAPLIAFGIEVILLLLIGGIWMMILQDQPEFLEEITVLIEKLQQSTVTQEMVDQLAAKIIAQPGVISTGFIYLAVLVPLVEELIKPAAIWLVLGRKPSSRTGFLMGAAAGAGYALFENLTIGADAEIWTFVTITRLGTAAVHILTTGIVGWGLASAWTEKRYLRLVGSLISAMIFHGVWNSLNLFTSFALYPEIKDQIGEFGILFGTYAPVGLVILALGAVAGLIRANRFFQRAIIPQEKLT